MLGGCAVGSAAGVECDFWLIVLLFSCFFRLLFCLVVNCNCMV